MQLSTRIVLPTPPLDFGPVKALRAIPRTDNTARDTIVIRTAHWLSIVSRDVDPRIEANTDLEISRSDRFKRRIG